MQTTQWYGHQCVKGVRKVTEEERKRENKKDLGFCSPENGHSSGDIRLQLQLQEVIGGET